MSKTIQVLVVDDSRVAEELLVHELNAAPGLTVMGTAHDGQEAVEFVLRHKPDVVVMDLHMPRMDGVAATRRIMELQPVPIVAVSSSYDPNEVAANFRTLEAGAVAVMAKPAGPGHADYAELTRRMIETVTLMAEVRVIRRRPPKPIAAVAATVSPVPRKADNAGAAGNGEIRLIAIGVSTGGPPVLQTILARLPKSLPVPVVIVQHIAPGFLPGMAEWLAHTTGFPVRLPVAGEWLAPGVAYLGPDGRHFGVTRDGRAILSEVPPENGLRPAVSFLFRSVAECYGRAVAAVLLTGMGRDGADELLQLRQRGAVTIAQDKESSLVHGMPGEAIQLDAAVHVLAPEQIAALLATMVGRAP